MQAPKNQSALVSPKHAHQTQKTLALYAQQQLTQEDIWYIRDRLHERCSFFRLWPSQLQQLLCKLATPKHWVQNEVLASQGCKPTHVCFILEGEAAVAVRSAPGSSLLRDVALLKSGDTFGELSLLGVQRHPAFIVVRSPQLWALAVDAQQLAQAMLKQQKLMVTDTTSGAATQAKHDDEPSISIDALYKLIGETGGGEKSALTQQQQMQVQRVRSQQLQKAVAAEEATVGAWLAPPHKQQQQRQQQPPMACGAAGTSRGAADPRERSSGMRTAHTCPSAPGQVQSKFGQLPRSEVAGKNANNRAVQEEQHSADSVGPGTLQLEAEWAQPKDGTVGDVAAGSTSDCSDDAPKQSSLMLRARHSAILHMAMMKAGSHVPEQPSK